MTTSPASMTGELTRWDDDRGFGFLTPLDGGPDVFLHISAYPRASGRPQLGDLVNFAIRRADGGKFRAPHVELIRTTATAARIAPRAHASRQSRASRLAALIIGVAVIAAFVVLALAVNSVWALQEWVAALYLTLSIVSFGAYAVDKSAAVAGRRRTRESTLLGLGLLGGWPGAILAQQILRHKIRKRRFMVAFTGTVVANTGAFVVLVSPLGERALAALAEAV